MIRTVFYLVMVCSACLFLNGCGATISQIPIRGQLGGQRIQTTVDSQIARYYLEHYLEGRRIDAALDTAFDQIKCCANGELPDREFLRHLSQRFSVDFASLYLAKTLLERKDNQSIETIYQQELDFLRIESPHRFSGREQRLSSDYVIFFVPGWDYVESGSSTGADFARPRQIMTELNLENYLVKIDPTGNVQRNAKIVAEEIARDRYRGKRVIVVSASSGGPSAAQALGSLMTPQQLQDVKAWVNIGGVLQGSPVSDHYLSWPRSIIARIILFIKGWRFDSIRSLSVKENRDRFAALEFPEHLLIINYVGLPLSGDISRRAKDTYPLLRKFGPNDGMTLIADELAPNSLTILDIGMDHYFNEDPEIDRKTAALTRCILAVLEGKNQPKSTPSWQKWE